MAKGKAQAQALAQKTAAISSTESYQLVHCLIRVSVYHVCWMRGLFPEKSFSGHDLAQLDKLHIKLLKPSEEDEEASTLQKWVEQGVMDAVQQGYLKNMYFGIAQDAEATHLLEEYIYSFKYGADGVEFEMKTTAHGKARDKYSSADTKKKTPPHVDVVRYQVVRLMRMLVQVCQTLDEVPEERYLFIKLTYHDHTPDEYEPPFFHAVQDEGISHFSRRPFSMEVGGMDTHHHTVSVRVKSVLDTCGDMDAQDDEQMQELEGSQQLFGMEGGGNGDGDEDMEMADREQEGHAAAGTDQHLQLQHNPKQHVDEAERMLSGTEEQPEDNSMLAGADHQTDPAALAAPAASADETQASQEEEEEGGAAAAADGEEEQQQQFLASPVSPQEAGASGQAYERVRSYCLARGGGSVNYVDVMTSFYDLPGTQLQLVFDGLHREGLLQPGPDKDTFLVVQQGQAAPAPAAAGFGSRFPPGSLGAEQQQQPGPQAGPDSPLSALQGSQAEPDAEDPSQAQPEGFADPMMLVDEEEGQGEAGKASPEEQRRRRGRQQQQQYQQISQMMTGLSMGGNRAAGGAGTAGVKAVNGSVMGRAVRAGSDVSGLPAAPPGAPTAAANQVDPAAADEPSVQLPQDQEQHHIWFEASQQSYRGPAGAETPGAAAAAAAGGPAAVQAAASAPVGRLTRLRKASYVDKPIYQHTGKQRNGGGGSSRRKEGGEAEREPLAAVHKTANKVVRKNNGGKAAAAAAAAAGRGNQSRLSSMK